MWAVFGHSLRVAQMAALRTEPPYARAAIADAENARGCGMVLAVKQHESSEQSLKACLKGEIQSTISPQSGPTNEERDDVQIRYS